MSVPLDTQKAKIQLDPAKSSAAVWLWVGGLLIYFAIQFQMVAEPIRLRHAPLETDDAYAYILYGQQFLNCFRQQAPAYDDLREQLTLPTDDPRLGWLRTNHLARFLLIHSLPHSAVLAGLKTLGCSWDTAYNLVQLAGVFFIGGALAYWLRALWGRTVAGLALVLLAPAVFTGHGIHYVVPSNLCLGVALLIWGRIVRTRGQAPAFLLVGLLLMLSLHSMGKFYAGLTLALQFLLDRQRWSGRNLGLLAGGAGLLGLSLLLPRLVEHPCMHAQAWVSGADWQGWAGIRHNLTGARQTLGEWIDYRAGNQFGWLWPLGLPVLGLLGTPRDRRGAVCATVLVLAAGLIATMFVILPIYEAEAFRRAWVAAEILLAGATAQFLLIFFRLAAAAARSWRNAPRRPWFSRTRGLTRRGLQTLVVFALSLLLLRAVPLGLYEQFMERQAVQRCLMLERYPLELDPGQVAQIRRQAAPGDQVLYLDLVMALFGLVHDAQNLGAVYGPALIDTPAEAKYVRNNPHIRFVSLRTPLKEFYRRDQPTVTWGQIPLAPGGILKLTTGRSFVPGEVRLDWAGAAPPGLALDWLDRPGREKAAGSAPEEAFGLELRLPANAPPAVLRGIRLSSKSERQWPWGAGNWLYWIPDRPQAPPVAVSLDSASFMPALAGDFEVAADRGSSLLLEKVNP